MTDKNRYTHISDILKHAIDLHYRILSAFHSNTYLCMFICVFGIWVGFVHMCISWYL